MHPWPAGGDYPRFEPAEGGYGVAHTTIGSQVAEIHVPGLSLGESDGSRMEDIELERGPARVQLDGPPSGGASKPFVQVGFFPGTQEPCSSFTVTVDGGSEAANRQTAIDLAERILLPSELGDLDLPGTEGGPVAGLTLADSEWAVSTGAQWPTPILMSFTDSTVTWDNGCATVSANYELDRDDGILTVTNPTSSSPGCTPRTTPELAARGAPLPWPEIEAVMGSERISADYIAGVLRLGDTAGPYIYLNNG